MEIIEQINKTREYLDYIEDHFLNVQKAFKEIELKCSDMRFISDDLFYHTLRAAVEFHDASKLSKEEFTPYRCTFFPTQTEGEADLGSAWEHHKICNDHHWENWANQTGCTIHPDDWETACAHMIIDWMAMGYKFGDTARQYYEKNKDKIKVPDIAIRFMYEIFDRIEA